MRRKTGHVFLLGYLTHGVAARIKNVAPLGWAPEDQVASAVEGLGAHGLSGLVVFERGIESREDMTRLMRHVSNGRPLMEFAQAEPVADFKEAAVTDALDVSEISGTAPATALAPGA